MTQIKDIGGKPLTGDPVKDLISFIDWIRPLTNLKEEIIKEKIDCGFRLMDIHFIPLLDAAQSRWERSFGKPLNIDVFQERDVARHYVTVQNKQS